MSTPLLALFRRGDIPLDVRLLAADGGLVWEAAEQLDLLVFLLGDSEPAVADRAERTLGRISVDPLLAIMARPDVTTETREALVARGIDPDPVPAGEDVTAVEETTESGPGLSESRPQVLASKAVIDRIKIARRGSREQRSCSFVTPTRSWPWRCSAAPS